MAFSNSSNDDTKCFMQFRGNERILNSQQVSFTNKIVALIGVWDTIAEININECTINDLLQIIEWAKLHALNIILQADWPQFSMDYQAILEKKIERSKFQLAKARTDFLVPCEKLLDVLKNPWRHPILLKVLQNEACSYEQMLHLFRAETAYLTSVRLMKLCESRCEDLAINLANAFIDSLHLSYDNNEAIEATYSQVRYIFDVFVCLLYKHSIQPKLFVVLRTLSLEEGLNLVQRLASKNKRKMKIWSFASHVAKYAAQIYISLMALKYTNELEHMLKTLVKLYYDLCLKISNLSEFINAIRRISDITNRSGLHKLCEFVHSIDDVSLKELQIEMYIKVITTDINECETSKDSNDPTRVELITTTLAATFCQLAGLLDDHIDVARECVLTAFSLKPTVECLNMLEMCAIRSGITVEPLPTWKCKLHPPVLETDDVMWICSECGEWTTDPQLTRPLQNNITLHQIMRYEVLGIPQTLCDDLSVCISYSRYQVLSWYQSWNELHRLCAMYLKDPVGTKRFITDLKYVDIDYSIFKNIKKEPIDDLDGIERGYEQYLFPDTTVLEEEIPKQEDQNMLTNSNSSLKEFIVKLTPLHITADHFISPTVVLERDNSIQEILKEQSVRKSKSKKRKINTEE